VAAERNIRSRFNNAVDRANDRWWPDSGIEAM
jgi:hypothetical protein